MIVGGTMIYFTKFPINFLKLLFHDPKKKSNQIKVKFTLR